jgi:cellulose synthase/poly-beta-1,6-N-acetylglucosamine synthase-like glycosyltransferase
MTTIFILTFTFLAAFFITDFFVRRLFMRLHERIRDYNYTHIGVIIIFLGAFMQGYTLFYAVTEPFHRFVTALYGFGFGIVIHHILYKGFLWSQDRELSIAQRYNKQINRGLEILPGLMTYVVLVSPVILALRLPIMLIYLVILCDVYWFYKAMRIAIFVIIGYRKMRQAEKTDWVEKLEAEHPDDLKRLYHIFAIPTYKERLEVLEPNFKAIVESNYPKERLFIALGLEEKDTEIGPKNAEYLMQKYGDKIGGIFISVNRLKEGELQGPATNRNSAIRNAKLEMDKRGIDLKDVLVTTLDADFVIHPQFIAAATHTYLSQPAEERDKRSFTGVFLYNNNYWTTPAPMRVMAVSTAFWQLSEMAYSDKYVNFASLTMSFKSLWEIGLWMPDKVNDDSGFYWKAYYHFNGDYRVVPHFVPLSADAVQDVTFVKTLQNQYLQYRRWAYGVEHIPYIVTSYFKGKEIPFLDRTGKLLFVLFSYGSWATLALLVTFGGMVIPIVNPAFDKTTISQNLPVISSYILTFSFISLFLTVYMHEKIVPPRPTKWKFYQRVLSFFQWALVPVIILTFGTIPALDAQTRLMLGQYMKYRVTNKARKVESGTSDKEVSIV